jgi:hypothetical protein
MKSYVIHSDKLYISETEIADIVIEFLIDGRSVSECRGHLLGEYDVNADELGPLLERAQREIREYEMEIGTRLRF